MATKIQLRRDTAEAWESADPVLAAGEVGVERNSGRFKIGDGVTAWSELGYSSVLPESLGSAAAASTSDFATAAQGEKADSAYQLPEAGVPATDLAEVVRTSLTKADDALPAAEKGADDGVAELVGGKVPHAQVDVQSIADDPVTKAAYGDPFPEAMLSAGDSLTVSVGGDGSYWGETLADDIGLDWALSAIGGQTTSEVALRVGALDPVVTVDSDTIPASGAVSVTMVTAGAWKLKDFSFTGTLAGVEGVLSHDDSTPVEWTFTRSAAGSAVAVDSGGVAFHCTEQDSQRGSVLVLWAGTNNMGGTDEDETDFVVGYRDIDLIIRHLSRGNDRYYVLGLHDVDNGDTAIKQRINGVLAARFEGNWLDAHAYLHANGLILAGITPTVSDILAYDQNFIPPSLLDGGVGVHLVQGGYDTIRAMVKQAMAGDRIVAGLIPVDATTGDAAPTLDTAGTNTLTIDWTAVDGADAYAIHIVPEADYNNSDPDASPWVWADNTDGLTSTIGSAAPALLYADTSYVVRVTPYNAAGAGSSSYLTTATTGTALAIITSETWSGAAGDIGTTDTDAVLGGTAKTWITDNGAADRDGSGGMVQGGNHAYLDTGSNDHRVSAVVSTLVTSGRTKVIARMTDVNNYYSAEVLPGGQLYIAKRVSGTDTVLASLPAGAMTSHFPDGVLELRTVGTSLRAIVNGVTYLTVTDSSLTTGQYAGLRTTVGTTTWGQVIIYDK